MIEIVAQNYGDLNLTLFKQVFIVIFSQNCVKLLFNNILKQYIQTVSVSDAVLY